MTGERQLAEGEKSGGAGGAKNPTMRILGSMTAREPRRASMVVVK